MMSTFEKLNLKNNRRIIVLNAPESFEPELWALRDVTILRELPGAGDAGFALAFVTRQHEVDSLAKAIAEQTKGDAVVWFAYPKGTSKNYKSEINRDNGWRILGQKGFEPVRSVAIDEDWSAVRFRRVEFIKTMTRAREHRMTAAGKARATKG
ncbi:MAG TPA: hypothetical protein VGG72_12425 [Bryobacteraceae bacterium]|jgi:hypothetical protein